MQTAQRTPPVWDDEVTRLWDEPGAFADEPTTPTPRPRGRARLTPEETPQPTGQPWSRRLVTAGLVLLLALVALALSTDWLRVRLDDLRYGRPRTTHISAFVGHADGDGVPTHLIAVNPIAASPSSSCPAVTPPRPASSLVRIWSARTRI
jgi:hypothetical protein